MTARGQISSWALALAIAVGVFAPPMLGHAGDRRGNLTSAQKADFAKQKRSIVQRQRAIRQQIDTLQPQLDEATRDFNALAADMMARRGELARLRRTVSDRENSERLVSQRLGIPNNPTPELILARRAIQQQELVLSQNIEPRYNAAHTRMSDLLTSMNQARAADNQTVSDLAVRKVNKAAARAADLKASQDRKAARRAARLQNPQSAALVQQPVLPSAPPLSDRSSRSSSSSLPGGPSAPPLSDGSSRSSGSQLSSRSGSSIFADFLIANSGPSQRSMPPLSGIARRGSAEFSELRPDSEVPSSRPGSTQLSPLTPDGDDTSSLSPSRRYSLALDSIFADTSSRESTGPTRPAPRAPALSSASSSDPGELPRLSYGSVRDVRAGSQRTSSSAQTSGFTTMPPETAREMRRWKEFDNANPQF